MSDFTKQFTSRKKDHIQLSLLDETEAANRNDLARIELIHDSLPDLDLDAVSIESSFLDQTIATPFYVAGMTAGHDSAASINERIAEVAAHRGWLFGLGSQRRELSLDYSDATIVKLRQNFPQLKIISNLGIAQLIELDRTQSVARFIEVANRSHASLVAIHLNPLQEAIQAEGTPNYKNALSALNALIEGSNLPVVIKETGSGMSLATLNKIKNIGLFAVDVSGLGGTHWGRIEGKRAAVGTHSNQLGEVFRDWGVSTVESVMNAQSVLKSSVEVWASGGVRSGLDAAKLLALGAKRVGFAKPALQAALESANAVDHWMSQIEKELKVAMFCTDSARIEDLNQTKVRGTYGSV